MSYKPERKYLSRRFTETLMHAIITAKIDYCLQQPFVWTSRLKYIYIYMPKLQRKANLKHICRFSIIIQIVGILIVLHI